MKSSRLLVLVLCVCCLGAPTLFAQQPMPAPQPPASPPSAAAPAYADFRAAKAAGQAFQQAKDYEKAAQAFDIAVILAANDPERAEVLFGAGEALRSVVRHFSGARGRPARTEYGDWFGAQSRYRRILQLKDVPNETKFKAGAAIFDAPSDKLSDPLSVFTTILALPNLTAEDKANWLARRGQYYVSLILTTAYPSQQQTLQTATLALADYTEVAAMSQIPDAKKAEAFLQIGYLQTGLKQLDKALESYKQTLQLAQALDGQKAQALMKSAELQAYLGKTTEAIASVTQVFTLKSLKAGDKVSAHKMLANAYFQQKNLPAAIAELGKISAIPDLTGYAKVSALEGNGDLLLNVNAPAAARTEFEKALAVPPTDKSRIAYLHMKIGKTLLAEKNYAKARAALQTGVDVEGANSSYKEEAWQVLGDTLTQEKNYPAAIEAYQKVTTDAKANAFIWLQSALGLGHAAKLTGNFDQAAAAYDSVLKNYFSDNMSPVHRQTLQANKQAIFTLIQNIGVEFSKTATSHPAALTIFLSFVKNAKYNAAELSAIYLAWGDMLVQQNKLAEAVALYQKIPPAQPQSAEALKKRQELAPKLNATGNPQE